MLSGASSSCLPSVGLLMNSLCWLWDGLIGTGRSSSVESTGSSFGLGDGLLMLSISSAVLNSRSDVAMDGGDAVCWLCPARANTEAEEDPDDAAAAEGWVVVAVDVDTGSKIRCKTSVGSGGSFLWSCRIEARDTAASSDNVATATAAAAGLVFISLSWRCSRPDSPFVLGWFSPELCSLQASEKDVLDKRCVSARDPPIGVVIIGSEVRRAVVPAALPHTFGFFVLPFVYPITQSESIVVVAGKGRDRAV